MGNRVKEWKNTWRAEELMEGKKTELSGARRFWVEQYFPPHSLIPLFNSLDRLMASFQLPYASSHSMPGNRLALVCWLLSRNIACSSSCLTMALLSLIIMTFGNIEVIALVKTLLSFSVTLSPDTSLIAVSRSGKSSS